MRVDDQDFDFDTQQRQAVRQFIRALQMELPRRHYALTNRLYKIAAYLVGDTGVRGLGKADKDTVDGLRREYPGWDDFVEVLAERDLVAARIETYVRHRQRTLGLRPAWFKGVNAMRPTGQGLAIRHIVPSHLLGYAAEKLSPDYLAEPALLEGLEETHLTRCDAWLRVKELGETPRIEEDLERTVWKSLSRVQKRQRVWALLHNHPGNLWVGGDWENSIIGFLHGAVQSVVHKFERGSGGSGVKVTPSRTRADVEKFLPDWIREPKYGHQDLHDEIVEVVNGVVYSLINEESPIDGIAEFLEDVAANLDLDLPDLSAWQEVVEWRRKFESAEATLDDIERFLAVNFPGSLMSNKGDGEPERTDTDTI